MNNGYGRPTGLTFLLLLGAILFGLLPEQAWAHGGVKIDEDVCKLFIGNYSLHFTGYQLKAADHADHHADHGHPADDANRKEFCHDIPGLGYTVVVLDAVDPELREMPLEVRIVHDTEDLSNLEAITILHIPPKIYPAGTVAIEYTFDKPGKFVGMVTVGSGKSVLESRFPFSVAQAPSPFVRYIPFLAIVLAGAGLYWYSNRRYAANWRKKALSSGQPTPSV